MLTSTTKSLLAPISDAVAQLIVITAHAELANAPIPDLREVAEAVATQVHNLADLGNGLLDSDALMAETGGHADVGALQQRMQAACEQVRKAAAQLALVADDLAADPLSASGRNRLVDATREILYGTRAILDTYDDAEVQKIVLVARNWSRRIQELELVLPAASSYQKLEVTRTTANKPDASHIRQIAQQAVFLLHLVLTRVPEVLSPMIQGHLLSGSSDLEGVSFDLVATFRLIAAQPPDSLSVAKILRTHINTAEQVSTLIQKYVQMNDMEEGATGSAGAVLGGIDVRSLRQGLGDAMALARVDGFKIRSVRIGTGVTGRSPDEVELGGLIEQLQGHTAQQPLDPAALLEDARGIMQCAAITNRPSVQQEALPHLQGLENAASAPDLTSLDLYKKLVADAYLQASAEAALGAVRAADLAARGDVALGLQAALANIAGPEKTDQESLRKVSAQGALDYQPLHHLVQIAADGKPTEEAAREFTKAISLASEALRGLGMDAAADSLKHRAPGVIAAATVLEGATGDLKRMTSLEGPGAGKDEVSEAIAVRDAAIVYLGHVLGEWNKETSAIIAAVGTEMATEASVASSVVKVGSLVEQLRTARQVEGGTSASVQKLATALGRAVAQLTASLQREADNTTDEAYRGSLFALARGLTDATTKSDDVAVLDYLQKTASLVGKEKQLQLVVPPPVKEDAIKEQVAVKNASLLGRADGESKVLVDETIKDASASEASQASQDVVVVYEEAPKPLSEEEAKENPLKAAAQELVVETSKWSKQANPVVAAATDISDRLAVLAEHYRSVAPASKIQLLERTKEVVVLCNQLQQHVDQIATSCTDKRLRAALLADAERLPTLSQQLKILASVKAGAVTATQGADAERLLVTCSYNLMASVREVLRRGAAASIRSTMRGTATVGIAVVKFKRNLFKGRKAKEEGAKKPAAAAKSLSNASVVKPVGGASLRQTGSVDDTSQVKKAAGQHHSTPGTRKSEDSISSSDGLTKSKEPFKSAAVAPPKKDASTASPKKDSPIKKQDSKPSVSGDEPVSGVATGPKLGRVAAMAASVDQSAAGAGASRAASHSKPVGKPLASSMDKLSQSSKENLEGGLSPKSRSKGGTFRAENLLWKKSTNPGT